MKMGYLKNILITCISYDTKNNISGWIQMNWQSQYLLSHVCLKTTSVSEILAYDNTIIIVYEDVSEFIFMPVIYIINTV